MNPVKCILVLEKQEDAAKVTAGLPNCLIDVLGKSVLQRTIQSLFASAVDEVIVVADEDLVTPALNEQAKGARIAATNMSQLWQTAEQVFLSLTECASDVFLIRMNAYLELNWQGIVEHHGRHSNRVTRIVYGEMYQPVDACLVSAAWRNEAAFVLRNELRETRTNCVPYMVNQSGDEYLNPLRNENDLRRLAADSLFSNCKMRPEGTEIRPGVWVGAGSRINKMARLVAPVFVGRRARVCAGAVITRGTAIEHHAVIGNKTVIENGTILPYTHLGPGLEVSHSVVGERHIFHLQRNISTPIQDPRLVDRIPQSAGIRTLASAARLLSFMTGRVWRGLQGKKDSPTPVAESSVSYSEIYSSANNEQSPTPQVPGGLAIARRYGNQ